MSFNTLISELPRMVRSGHSVVLAIRRVAAFIAVESKEKYSSVWATENEEEYFCLPDRKKRYCTCKRWVVKGAQRWGGGMEGWLVISGVVLCERDHAGSPSPAHRANRNFRVRVSRVVEGTTAVRTRKHSSSVKSGQPPLMAQKSWAWYSTMHIFWGMTVVFVPAQNHGESREVEESGCGKQPREVVGHREQHHERRTSVSFLSQPHQPYAEIGLLFSGRFSDLLHKLFTMFAVPSRRSLSNSPRH